MHVGDELAGHIIRLVKVAITSGRMAAALLGDPSVIGRPRPRLSDARVEAEIADKPLRLREARHLADRRHHGERYDHVDARNRH